MRNIFTCNSAPAFTLTNRATSSSASKHTSLISLPMMSRYSNEDMDSLSIERLFISMKDSASSEVRNNMTSDLKSVLNSYESSSITFWDANDS